jgi:hypothetical protein
MHIRTRYRMSAVPMPLFGICLACLVALVAILAVDPIHALLAEQLHVLPWVVLVVAAAAPLAFCAWYLLTWAEVRNGRFRIRSLGRVNRVDLRRLASVEVYPRSGSGDGGRHRHDLVLCLEDEQGAQAWLPLNVWRDENLLMARILRATVERRVKIEGDPLLVKRFGGLLDTYKSWDSQQGRQAA